MPELDLGNVKGPQGKSAYQSALDAGYSGSEEAFNTAMAKAPDAVLYTAQSLTDEQKAQARGNINSAPGGFGLGELTGRTANSFSDITGYGFYRVPSESGFAPDASSNWGAVYIGVSLSYGTLLYARNNALLAARAVSDGEVGPIEWVNPPMELGTEYRTTERYLGKPVYVKTFNIPTSVFTNQVVDYAHGIANLDRIVDSFVCCRADYIRILPWSYYALAEWSAQYMLNSSTIKFELGSSALERIKEYTNGVDVTLKYTKTTD